MQQLKAATGIVIVSIILLFIISIFMPTPTGANWWAFYLHLSIALGTAAGFVGGSIIFLRGLNGFTPALKKAYRILAVGLIMLGIAFVGLPLVLYGGPIEAAFKGSRAAAILFVFAFLAIYASTRLFAKLFKIHNFTTTWWFALIPSLLLSVGIFFIPHVPTKTDEFAFDAANAFTLFSTWIAYASSIHFYQIKKRASLQYTNALAWMILSFVIMGSSGLLDMIGLMALGDDQWFLVGALPMLPLFVASLCFLRAAYAFNLISLGKFNTNLDTLSARTFFGKQVTSAPNSKVSSIDIVTYAANLASSPQAIDPLLDRLRAVTSRIKPDEKLSQTDNLTLKKVYLDIEQYLIDEEPVREFSQESLRQTIANGLKLGTKSETFWPELAKKA